MKNSPKKKGCVISITLGDVKLKGTGETILEALASIKRPVKIVGKTFVDASNGTKDTSFMLMPVRAKRLFYPLAQAILAKQIEQLLK